MNRKTIAVGLAICLIFWGMVFAAVVYAGTAFYVREKVDGLYKICYYDYLGSEYAITMRSYQVCPVTIQVNN